MDPVTATLLAAGIGALGTVIGAYIGRETGYRRGLEDGGRHSIERFMDIYKHDIERAVQHLDNREAERARDVARGLVDNVKVWRGIQKGLADLLNGLITELDGALSKGNNELATHMIRSIYDAYQGKRLAVEIELRRSQI